MLSVSFERVFEGTMHVLSCIARTLPVSLPTNDIRRRERSLSGSGQCTHNHSPCNSQIHTKHPRDAIRNQKQPRQHGEICNAQPASQPDRIPSIVRPQQFAALRVIKRKDQSTNSELLHTPDEHKTRTQRERQRPRGKIDRPKHICRILKVGHDAFGRCHGGQRHDRCGLIKSASLQSMWWGRAQSAIIKYPSIVLEKGCRRRFRDGNNQGTCMVYPINLPQTQVRSFVMYSTRPSVAGNGGAKDYRCTKTTLLLNARSSTVWTDKSRGLLFGNMVCDRCTHQGCDGRLDRM